MKPFTWKIKKFLITSRQKCAYKPKLNNFAYYLNTQNYFSIYNFYLNKIYKTNVELHFLKNEKSYADFCKYIERENNQIFYFFKKTKHVLFTYKNHFLNSDIVFIDLNFKVLFMLKNVEYNETIEFPQEAGFVLILPKNFTFVYQIRANDQINFYQKKF